MFYALLVCLRKSTKALDKINEYFLHTIEVCHFIEARCIACVKTIKLEHGHVRSYCCCRKLQSFPNFQYFHISTAYEKGCFIIHDIVLDRKHVI